MEIKIKMETRVMVRMRVRVRVRTRVMSSRRGRLRTVQVVNTTGVVYVEMVIKGRLDHLRMDVVITQVFLRAFLRSPPECLNQPLQGH